MTEQPRGRVTATYQIHVHDEGPDGLWAEVEQLPGCFASGFTHDELFEALREAISLYLSGDGVEVAVRNVKPSADRVETVDVELVS